MRLLVAIRGHGGVRMLHDHKLCRIVFEVFLDYLLRDVEYFLVWVELNPFNNLLAAALFDVVLDSAVTGPHPVIVYIVLRVHIQQPAKGTQ